MSAFLPFYRLQGLSLLVLIGVTVIYAYWFAAIGPYADLQNYSGLPLEERVYSGEDAAQILGALSQEGHRAKLLSLVLDVPHMILWALTLENLIAFGLRHLNLMRSKWLLVLALPIVFLAFDAFENTFLALTLVTGWGLFGTLASIMTPLKFLILIPSIIVALGLSAAGLVKWVGAKR